MTDDPMHDREEDPAVLAEAQRVAASQPGKADNPRREAVARALYRHWFHEHLPDLEDVLAWEDLRPSRQSRWLAQANAALNALAAAEADAPALPDDLARRLREASELTPDMWDLCGDDLAEAADAIERQAEVNERQATEIMRLSGHLANRTASADRAATARAEAAERELTRLRAFIDSLAGTPPEAVRARLAHLAGAPAPAAPLSPTEIVRAFNAIDPADYMPGKPAAPVADGWRDIASDPPTQTSDILVCTSAGTVGEAHVAAGRWRWCNGTPIGEIVAWMPLPAPPAALQPQEARDGE